MSGVRSICFVVALGASFGAAAQEHRHPPQDVQLHEKFYSTWYMPDNPAKAAMLASTYGVVLVSIIIQGSTLGWVAKRTVGQ